MITRIIPIFLLICLLGCAQHQDDVCDFDRIYNENFQYSLDEEELQNFFRGIAFATPYSPSEMAHLRQDTNNIYRSILDQSPVHEKIAVISAGAPGAGKTSLIHQYLHREKKKVAYVDPDDVCLKQMANTWQKIPDQREGYAKWRSGSNAAAHFILANLIREGYAFYLGTTSTNARTPQLFQFLKDQGYRIHLVHVTAPDDVRWESNRKRSEIFVQVTDEDIQKKGKMFPMRIQDSYLMYADQIDFHYRGGVDDDAILAAVWIRTKDKNPKGILTIYDLKAYENIIKVHDGICHELEDGERYLWKNTVEKSV